MKKFMALLVALLFAFAMTTVAFAAEKPAAAPTSHQAVKADENKMDEKKAEGKVAGKKEKKAKKKAKKAKKAEEKKEEQKEEKK